MFAVIRSGGKQYRVAKDDRIIVERIAGEPGTMIQLSDVLMVGGEGKAPTVGVPTVAKAAVFAEVLEHNRADKIIVFKKKRRNNYRRKAGHRQHQTVLRIVDVSPTGTAPTFTPTPKREPRPEPKKLKKAKAEPKKKPAKPAAPAAKESKPVAKTEDKAPKKVPTKSKREPSMKQSKTSAKKIATKSKTTGRSKSSGKGQA